MVKYIWSLALLLPSPYALQTRVYKINIKIIWIEFLHRVVSSVTKEHVRNYTERKIIGDHITHARTFSTGRGVEKGRGK